MILRILDDISEEAKNCYCGDTHYCSGKMLSAFDTRDAEVVLLQDSEYWC